ncbi:ABC-type branched-chain amino acid transport systems, ATPase component [Paramagnetospirillum magneticum AMB-1]|uniref:ABC-type branched-chain amino acid transport systems, ATPase component n=2 Tax=Paramagnetospirillum magneticum TaxID=84159 RepID=Q2W4U2_PARM1|nr:ABC-type branched-chain amino acid transport systems, ATPase component [Paramagnetospirillum magneticum AMB-1]
MNNIQVDVETGKTPTQVRRTRSPQGGVRMGDDLIVETRSLTKEFKGFVAVSDVNLKVRRHTIHALIGPNGAGKTTCFNLVTKFLTPTRGQILFNGNDITHTQPAAIARQGMVRSFQISAVFGHLTVLENVRVALQRKQGKSFQFWRSGECLNELNARAEELIEAVGVAEYRDTPAGELSYGRKRALEIATTLALDPEMLLLDEPMAGMGTEDVRRTAELIRRVAANRTILMVEHNLSVVADLSDTITVLKLGRVLAEGSYAEITDNPEVVEAYMGAGHGGAGHG